MRSFHSPRHAGHTGQLELTAGRLLAGSPLGRAPRQIWIVEQLLQQTGSVLFEGRQQAALQSSEVADALGGQLA